MNPRRPWPALSLLALLAGAACGAETATVAGRWQRVDQPREWIQFHDDGTFRGRSFMDTTEIRGRWRQRGQTVTTASEYGYRGTLTVRDTILVMQDGTRFRRAGRAP